MEAVVCDHNRKEDTKPLTRALIEHEISVTRIASTGGFLSGGNTTLMIEAWRRTGCRRRWMSSAKNPGAAIP